MLHKPFRHYLEVFQTRRTRSGTWWLSLKNSSYEPQKCHIFMLAQAYISKNGFSRCQNRFLRNFSWQCMKVFWVRNKVFWVWRTPQYLSMIISWHFEAIWRNRKKSSFFNFFASLASNLWRIWAFLSIKNFWKLFFQK